MTIRIGVDVNIGDPVVPEPQDIETGEPVYLTRLGRRVAVVVDPAVFERLVDDAEDALDRAELTLAREQDDYVPWEQVKAELGLT